MASVYTMMAYQVESIFHVKSVYTLLWPKVSTLCRHEDLVVYIMMWHWVSTFWCHQRVDKVSTFWWHVSSLSSHLSSLWCHQAMSTFCSHTKCLPYEAFPHEDLNFLGFSYKLPIAMRVQNYLNIMLNSPIIHQLLESIWENSQLVLVTSFA